MADVTLTAKFANTPMLGGTIDNLRANTTVGIVPGAAVDRHLSTGRRDERCIC